MSGWICPVCGEANAPFNSGCINGSHAKVGYGTSTNVLTDAALTQPHPQELVGELRRALGLFDGVMDMSPKEAWQRAIARVLQMRCWLEHGSNPEGHTAIEICDEHRKLMPK